MQPGDRILLADGSIELRAVDSDGTSVRTEVVNGGPISDHKGINLPGVNVSIPSLTEKDLADLHFGLTAGVDMVALSFVRSAEDVQQLRDRLGGRPVADRRQDRKAGGRGQHRTDPGRKPTGSWWRAATWASRSRSRKCRASRNRVIRRARRKARFVITATQMLESMIENPTPTRAEVSDVFNAIYDGTDAVMLSAETSIGKYPVEAVKFMARIAQEAEDSLRRKGFQDPPHSAEPSSAEILADAAHHAARESGAKAIVVFTSRGSSARLVSRYRPPVTIFAITPHDTTARQLSISYGVTPLLAPDVANTDEMLNLMDRVLVEGGYLKRGELVVFVAGQPVGRPGTTNLMKLHRIGMV